ncbi:EAL domain-containing protein [Bacillus sp. Marseille-P3661]|uniref:EAL domain-containing protein n=1 Tax=Bacillus sp. Marseille-P3661 TaxID=1936234 RepID=UPI000C81BB8F
MLFLWYVRRNEKNNGVREVIPPSKFISLAEEIGLIDPTISEWVLETACIQNKKWQEDGISPIRVGVNISPYLLSEELIVMVTRIKDKATNTIS